MYLKRAVYLVASLQAVPSTLSSLNHLGSKLLKYNKKWKGTELGEKEILWGCQE